MAFRSGPGRREFEVVGLAALRRGFQMSQSAGLVQRCYRFQDKNFGKASWIKAYCNTSMTDNAAQNLYLKTDNSGWKLGRNMAFIILF